MGEGGELEMVVLVRKSRVGIWIFVIGIVIMLILVNID